MFKSCDILIIGAGVAGITAACALWEKRPDWKIVLADREAETGGILRQCIHTGFGPDDLTGVLFGKQLEEKLRKTEVTLMMDCEITRLSYMEDSFYVSMVTPIAEQSLISRYVILAAGCYERPVGSLMISGTRPQGIFGAGELQRMINLEGYQPEKRAVVIGGGDIGLIIARRLIIKGCQIQRIIELQEESPALKRNKISCLEQYQLPLQVHSKVTEIFGEEHICGVMVEDLKTEQKEYVKCDLLVVAAGLIPDRTLLEDVTDTDKKIYRIGNCEKIYPSVEGIIHSVKNSCNEWIEEMN